MSYTKKTWASKELITTNAMNNIHTVRNNIFFSKEHPVDGLPSEEIVKLVLMMHIKILQV